jgi:hypothetical protein
MRRATQALAIVALAGAAAGCKEPNPDFVDDADGTSADASSTTPTSTSSTTDATTATTESTTGTSDDSTTIALEEGGTSSGDGSSSGAGSSGTAGACTDVDGDNMAPGDATVLGEQPCDAAPEQIAAVLVDETDDDWFAFHGVFVGNGECGGDDPLTSIAVGEPALTVCAYLSCDDGVAEVLDCGDGTAATTPMGAPGCCGEGMIALTFDCARSQDESATVFVHVSSAAPVECVDYALSWDFDA